MKEQLIEEKTIFLVFFWSRSLLSLLFTDLL